MNTQPKQIDEPAIAAAVTAERLTLCDLLDTLTPDDWQTQSLCPQWTVHDVVAHLTLATRDTTWDLLKGAIKARGNFDRMTADMAREHARRFAPPALVEQLRDTASSTRRAPLSSRLDPLVDVLVHGQDITRPLGRTHPMPPEHALPALDARHQQPLVRRQQAIRRRHPDRHRHRLVVRDGRPRPAAQQATCC